MFSVPLLCTCQVLPTVSDKKKKRGEVPGKRQRGENVHEENVVGCALRNKSSWSRIGQMEGLNGDAAAARTQPNQRDLQS